MIPLKKAAELAEQLRISTPRVYEIARRGDLPCVRLGRTLRFDPAAIERWIAEGGKALPGGWRRRPER